MHLLDYLMTDFPILQNIEYGYWTHLLDDNEKVIYILTNYLELLFFMIVNLEKSSIIDILNMFLQVVHKSNKTDTYFLNIETMLCLFDSIIEHYVCDTVFLFQLYNMRFECVSNDPLFVQNFDDEYKRWQQIELNLYHEICNEMNCHTSKANEFHKHLFKTDLCIISHKNYFINNVEEQLMAFVWNPKRYELWKNLTDEL